MSKYRDMFVVDNKEKALLYKNIPQKDINHLVKCFFETCPDLAVVIGELQYIVETNFNRISSADLNAKVEPSFVPFLESLLSRMFEREIHISAGYSVDKGVHYTYWTVERDKTRTYYTNFVKRLYDKTKLENTSFVLFPKQEELSKHEKKTFESLSNSEVIYFWKKENEYIYISNLNTKDNAIYRINKFHPYFNAIFDSLDND